MPLFRKSHKKDKDNRAADTTSAGRDDPKFSGSGGADPNFTGSNQPGQNIGQVPGYNSSQQPHPNEPDYNGSGYSASHSKPSRFGGKVETAIGTMVGSDTLRSKGIEKEREARSLNMQSNELAQAESLEREAQMHRDRAMGGGGGGNFMNKQR